MVFFLDPARQIRIQKFNIHCERYVFAFWDFPFLGKPEVVQVAAMVKEKRVDTLGPGNAFRDWLIEVLRERIADRNCKVHVYKIMPSSHTVCRYEFPPQDFSVVAKFYGEPTGWKRNYNPVRSMEKEFDTLKQIEPIINIPRPLAFRKDFHCVLLTEHVKEDPSTNA